MAVCINACVYDDVRVVAVCISACVLLGRGAAHAGRTGHVVGAVGGGRSARVAVCARRWGWAEGAVSACVSCYN